MRRIFVLVLIIGLLAGGALAETDRGTFALGLAYGGTTGFNGVSLRIQVNPALAVQPIFFFIADGELVGNASMRLNYNLGTVGSIYRYALVGGGVSTDWNYITGETILQYSAQVGVGLEWPWNLPWGLSQPLRQSLEFYLGADTGERIGMGLGHSLHYYF